MLSKVALTRAESERASRATVRDTADRDHRELLNYCNGKTDTESNALSPQLERLAQELSRATINLRTAGDAVRQAQRRMAEIERDRAVAQSNLNLATERWEQIPKQLDEAVAQQA